MLLFQQNYGGDDNDDGDDDDDDDDNDSDDGDDDDDGGKAASFVFLYDDSRLNIKVVSLSLLYVTTFSSRRGF